MSRYITGQKLPQRCHTNRLHITFTFTGVRSGVIIDLGLQSLLKSINSRYLDLGPDSLLLWEGSRGHAESLWSEYRVWIRTNCHLPYYRRLDLEHSVGNVVYHNDAWVPQTYDYVCGKMTGAIFLKTLKNIKSSRDLKHWKDWFAVLLVSLSLFLGLWFS